MFESVVSAGLSVLGLYLLAGCVFASVFHAGPIKKVDHAVDGASVGFRILITPGLVALWPLMWKRSKAGDGSWLGSQDRPVAPAALRRRHGLLICIVLVVVLVLAIPALIYRPAQPINPITNR
jgi:hypothetical protein